MTHSQVVVCSVRTLNTVLAASVIAQWILGGHIRWTLSGQYSPDVEQSAQTSLPATARTVCSTVALASVDKCSWQHNRQSIARQQTSPPHHTATVLRPSFRDHPGEPVPEENFWTLWCKGRLTEADILTIQLDATPSALTSAYLHHLPVFFNGPDARPAAQPTVSKHWRQLVHSD